MRSVRLGMIFDQEIRVGGGYQQALNAALLVKKIPTELVEPVYFTTLKENVSTLAEYGLLAIHLDLSKIQIASMRLRRFIKSGRFLRIIKCIEKNNAFERALVRQNIDLVYFLSPTGRAQDLERLNYITTVWDLCHRDDPEFPEVRWDRCLEGRDRNYQAILPRATAVLVDSELGKTNVIHRYGMDEARVHVMPFQAAVATQHRKERPVVARLDVKKKYLLDVPYIFYPAQFWAHKNHVYILEGLKQLEIKYGSIVGAIFSGGDRGNANYVEAYSEKLGLSDRVRFAGFVSNDEIPQLYEQSIALVMPTYFGPTNLPPLEAFELGVPVLYPDKAGLREQVGDAALLLNLTRPESLADHLNCLITDGGLRERLVAAGRERIRSLDSNERMQILSAVLEDFRWRRLCWK